MLDTLVRLSDRMLSRVVPRTAAAAQSCSYYRYCHPGCPASPSVRGHTVIRCCGSTCWQVEYGCGC